MSWSLWERGTWFASTNRYWAPNVCKALWNPKLYLSLTIKKACLKNKGGYSEQTLCSAWLCQQGHQCFPSPGGPLRKRGCQEVLGPDGRMLMVTVGTGGLAWTGFKCKRTTAPGEGVPHDLQGSWLPATQPYPGLIICGEFHFLTGINTLETSAL